MENRKLLLNSVSVLIAAASTADRSFSSGEESRSTYVLISCFYVYMCVSLPASLQSRDGKQARTKDLEGSSLPD